MKNMISLLAFASIIFLNTAAIARTLVYSDHEPLGNMRTTFLHEVFFSRIFKESNGQIQIEEHWNSELGKGYDALNNVKNDKID